MLRIYVDSWVTRAVSIDGVWTLPPSQLSSLSSNTDVTAVFGPGLHKEIERDLRVSK